MPGANAKRYACTICKDSFDEIILVRRHWNDVHKMINAQVCKICEIPFANKELLLKHKHATHNVFCNLCGRGYNNANQLDDHVNAVHNTSPNYTCRICAMNFNRSKLLIDHMREHEAWESWLGPLIFTCQVCGTKFLEEKQLQDHEKTHNKAWNSKVTKEQSFQRLKAPKKNKKKNKNRQPRR